eukprot:GILK01007914.1.p1 GENE.GILK01007914.1~~GILK01007914.1.p1  ORF type:complete len:241 (+),score=6.07 GILK01007914.1:55-777(+)
MSDAVQTTEAQAGDVPIAQETGETAVQSVWFKPVMRALMLPLMATLAILIVSFGLDDWARGSLEVVKLKLFHPVVNVSYILSDTYYNYDSFLQERCNRGVCVYAGLTDRQDEVCLAVWRLFPLFLARAAGGLSLMVVLGCTTISFCSVTIRSSDSTTLRHCGTLSARLLSLVCVFAVGFCFSELAMPVTGHFVPGISFTLFVAGTCGVVFTTICLWALLLSTRTNRPVFQVDVPPKNEGK